MSNYFRIDILKGLRNSKKKSQRVFGCLVVLAYVCRNRTKMEEGNYKVYHIISNPTLPADSRMEYVGLTKRPLKERMAGHRRDSSNGGIVLESPTSEVRLIAEGLTEVEAAELERSFYYERKAAGAELTNVESMLGNTGGREGAECEWNGVRYESQAEAARALGVLQTTMHNRLSKGYTCDSDVPGVGSWLGAECEWDGVRYESQADAARANGISPAAMSRRLSKGYTCDADVPANISTCEWNGVSYPSQADAARANGASQQTIGKWIRKGYTCDSDVPGCDSACEWNGVTYSSQSEAARANGVAVDTMGYRIRKGHTCDSDLKRRKK